MDYQEFLNRKHVRQQSVGHDVGIESINSRLFPWQREVVRWALRKGRAALFEDCGLGKTVQQLEWASHIHRITGGKILLLCPIAVQWQTKDELAKFGIDAECVIAESQAESCNGITIANYEKLHHFDADKFIGVVLDESSILKSYTGTTKRALCERFSRTPYKLACTATPAPNDRMELGNQSEFLGIMPSPEMLQRWFINDGGKAGDYRLRRHGAGDFWRWMASWSVCLSTPEDIGFDGSQYVLPRLITHEHVIECKPEPGMLFAMEHNISATSVHKEKRAYLDERADIAAELANSDRDSWAVWCDTDYEADALLARIPDAVEVRGSHKQAEKERGLRAFSDGTARVIITKAEIGGFGLNWQHAHKTTWFAGYSYERWYQAIRRLLRFGQLHDVECHLIRTVNEGSIMESIARKQKENSELHREMALRMRDGMLDELGLKNNPQKYVATQTIEIPKWLKTRKQPCTH